MLFCALSASAETLQELDRKVNKFELLMNPVPWHWRYKIGDVAGFEKPGFDDSSWKTEDSAEIEWGEEASACLRARITMPEKSAGVSIDGKRVSLVFRIDDGGTVYVNGVSEGEFKLNRPDAHKIVITEHASPGEVYNIAIKAYNNGGPGALEVCRLEFDGTSEIRNKLSQFIDSYRLARDLYKIVDNKDQAAYLSKLSDAVNSVDNTALTDGKLQRLVESIDTATSVLAEANKMLGDMSISVAGHAHIDMNWLWLWPETVEVCKNTFGTMCTLMDEYPGFVFTQSQPATYLAMQQQYPDIFARIKEKIKSGQWEVVGTTWTEGDMNMASGESIVRSIMYGKRYMKDQFGVESEICWEPDTFGHPWTLPQILAKSGIKYYYFMRTGHDDPVFWWQAPDGSKVLAYNCKSYNGDINDSEIVNDAFDFAKKTGLKDYLHTYGAGDHGGGPTRDMLNRVNTLQSREDYPQIKYTRVSDYFKNILKLKQDYPVWNNELNTIFEGCYTTHADVKRWNRESENLIPCAEKFSAIAANWGVQYPASDFVDSWRNTCFNQFHDILCGSAIHDSYIYSQELYEKATSQAKSARDKALESIAKQVATEGDGTPIVIFNSLSWQRTDPVEVESPFPGERTIVEVRDGQGGVIRAHNIGDKLVFTARDVPALGYKVFWAKQVESVGPGGVTADGTTIENQYFRVSVDRDKGIISEIYDKANGRSIIPQGTGSAILSVQSEKPHGMSAWSIGGIAEEKKLLEESEVILTESGPARACLMFDHTYGDSQFTQEVRLYDAVPRIDIRMTADWQEQGGPDKNSPMLRIDFPTSIKADKATFEIPFGSIDRPANGAEVPAQKWIDLSEAKYGVSLLNDCKYGFHVKDGVLGMTLLRAPYEPDPAPDKGIHEITYSLYPHRGDWRSAGTVMKGYELNEPLIALVTDKHQGTLPKFKSFLSVSAPNIVVTSLKRAEDDDSLILRFYETDGADCKAAIKLGLPVDSAVETDLMEREVGEKIPVKDGAFTVEVKKYEIKTYKLYRPKQ